MTFPPLESGTSRLLLPRPNDEQIADYYSAVIGTNIVDTILWDGPSGLEELQDWWTATQQRSTSPCLRGAL